MAPAYSEICFALGRGDAVVGVTDFCVFPPEVTRAARVGGFLNPDLEKIAHLRPDLVLTAPEQGQLRQNLEALGLRTRTLPVYSVADIFAAVEAVGKELGAEEAARRLSATLRDATAPRPLPPGVRPPRTLLVVGRNPGELSGIFVAGPGTFLSEVLGRAGGANVCPEGILYPTLSLEGIASLDPEVILELRPGEGLTEARRAALVADWDRMPFLRAVKSRRVFVLTEDWVDIPGPRVVQTLRLFHRLLHP
ncbi:MAG: ABC transporter substrate-binding protein [Acidobacteria bacterium]|nr:ABC transporter substrate-binding protein [Acidobacteriota bacterium]